MSDRRELKLHEPHPYAPVQELGQENRTNDISGSSRSFRIRRCLLYALQWELVVLHVYCSLIRQSSGLIKAF